MTAARRGPVVVDTNVFGAELTRRGAPVVEAYGRHVDGRDLAISFVTVGSTTSGTRASRC